MKKIVFTLLFVITSLFVFSQNICSVCDSLKIKSMTEYDYAAYKNYRQNCIIRDTVFYNKPVQLAVDNKSQSYTVNEKNYCGNYFSTATYNGDSVMISGYFIDKHDTVYLAVRDQEQQMKAIGSEIVIQIKKNVVFPKDERKKGNTGKVYTTFVLNEQGKPENAYVIKGRGKGLNEEAIRAINQLKLTPVMHQGRVVKFRMNLPINFTL